MAEHQPLIIQVAELVTPALTTVARLQRVPT